VLDTSKKVVHLASCNHLPDKQNSKIIKKSQAIKDGYTVCGICFAESQYLPDSGIEQTIQNKLSAELRHYNERLSDASLQAKVDTVGTEVLKHWPYPLINYQYGFSVVESNEINAFALPAGKIFLTSGLIRSLENDAELEAVMAHEIAHVERRHSLQTYREMVSNQKAQMALQIIGGIAMGAAAASNHSNAAGVIGGVTQPLWWRFK
jgi:predicted Zn-dependent protease